MDTQNKTMAFQERLDRLYRQLKSCDNHFMNTMDKISDDNQKVNAAYLFSISSYGLSFINNVFLNNAHSIGSIMDMRCIFENVAMYEHYLNGGFSEDGIELFKFQPYVLERAIYRKYPCFDNVLFSTDEIEKKYNEAKKTYKGTLEISAKLLSKLMRSPIPFLLKEDIPFVEIVEQNLGEVAAKIYKQLSIIIHPHDYRSQFDDIFIDIPLEENPFVQITLNLIENVFKTRPKGNEIEFGLAEEYLCYVEAPYLTANRQRDILFSLNDELLNVIKVAYEHKFPSLARMLDQIRHFSTSYWLDSTFGYSEQCIIKWKTVVEYFALFNYYIDNPYYLETNLLAYYHTNAISSEIIGHKITQDVKNKCYAEYLKVYPKGVTKEIFEEIYWGKTLGFLINECGEVPSINELAKSFLSNISLQIDEGKRIVAMLKNRDITYEQSFEVERNAENYDIKEMPLKESFTMWYEESQIMSHATGYLYFANTGVWTDGQCFEEYIFKFMQHILKRLYLLLSSTEMKQKTGGKTLANIVRNYLRNSTERINIYGMLARQPRTQKPKI